MFRHWEDDCCINTSVHILKANGLAVPLIRSFPDIKFQFNLCRCQSVLWKLPYSLTGLWEELFVPRSCSGLLADFNNTQWQHLKRAGCGWKQTTVIRSSRSPRHMRRAILSAENKYELYYWGEGHWLQSARAQTVLHCGEPLKGQLFGMQSHGWADLEMPENRCRM